MAALERLLVYLDEPGVSEIVIGLDRPIVIRVDGGYRPIGQQALSRDQIVSLVEGTPLAGMIDAARSLPAIELEACGRRLTVEVVREGANVALRIADVPGGAPIALPAAPRVSFTSPPQNVARTAGTTTPPVGVPIARAAGTTGSVPITRSAGTTTPPAGVPIGRSAGTTTPPAGVPVQRMTPATGVPVQRSATLPPGQSAPAISRTTTPPPSRTATPPMGVPLGVQATGSARVTSVTDAPTSRLAKTPPMGVRTTATTLPITNMAPVDGVPVEAELEMALVIEPWTGPRIMDERANVGGLVPLIRAARAAGATDLHLAAGRPIMIRRFGELVPLQSEALAAPVSPVLRAALALLTPQVAQGFLLPLLGPSARHRLGTLGYVDLAVDVPGAGRVRANVSQQQDGLCGTFRMIAQQTPTLEALGMPRELAKVVGHHQGLIVIAGPNGHGKTTTMAAFVDLLNSTRTDHIITIEDPVEIEHPARKALVSQREVNRHTLDFVSALKASLREDPDVIVIGELRDVETVEIALTAAETGHLVLATMSTPSAMRTIDRLIDMFPPDEQPQVRSSIAGTLRAVIAQRLLPRASGDGMVAAVELVTGVLPLSQMIRDNKLFQLPNLMQRGRAFGMIRLDDSLLELARNGTITEAVALASCDNRKEFTLALHPPQPPAGTAPGAPARGLFGWKGRE